MSGILSCPSGASDRPCWSGAGSARPLGTFEAQADLCLALGRMIVRGVLEDFPRLKIVISHAFWPWVEASCGLAFRRKNVYLHPDLYGTVFPGYRDWIERQYGAGEAR